MKTDSNRLNHLSGALSQGTITAGEHAELQSILRSDPNARQLWFLHQDLDAGLADLLRKTEGLHVSDGQSPVRKKHRTAWRPLTAAAAGLLVGLFSASMVLGLAVRSPELVVSVLREGFEQGPAPAVAGVPSATDRWSGDFSEVTRSLEGVRPPEGTHMLRLLRSDYLGRDVGKPSRQGDIMRVMDVRPYTRQVGESDVVVTLSALFNTTAYSVSERYDGMVTLYALGAGTELRGATEDTIKEAALAFSIGECRFLDRDSGTWQGATAQLLLPAGTESVMVKVSFRRVPLDGQSLAELPESIQFEGHFVDDVRATIRMRNPPARASSRPLP